MKSKSFIALAVLFLCACPAYAFTVFNDGKTHNIDYPVSGSEVSVYCHIPDMYTTVNWLDGGSVWILKGHENGRINVIGGYMSWLKSFHNSQVNISGGLINNFLYCCDSSHVNISGGTISDAVTSTDSCRIDISGGLIETHLLTHDFSQVNITGGSIEGYLALWQQSQIKIYGYDFAIDDQPFGFGELTSIFGGDPYSEPWRHLTGTLLSGEMIDNYFYIGDDAKIILTVPEPGTVLLLGLGVLFLKRRRR